VSEIGLKLQGSEQFLFLKIGTPEACFQTSGKVPWSSDAWKINVKAGAISELTSLKTSWEIIVRAISLVRFNVT